MLKIKNIYHLKEVLRRGEDSFLVVHETGGLSHPFIYYDKRFFVTYDSIDDGKEYTDVALLDDEVTGKALQSGRLYLKD